MTDGETQRTHPLTVEPAPLATGTAELNALSVLKAVAEALNQAVGLQEALDRSLEVVMPLVGSQAGWIKLLEAVEGKYLVAARNLPPALEADDRAAMRGSCQCNDLLRSGHLTESVNIIKCERLIQAVGDTRGLLDHASIPIRVAGRNLGILNLTTPADRRFTNTELALLTAVGAQIGVAVERARLHEQVKAQRIKEQAVLLNLSQALLGETNAQAIMDLAVRAAADSLPVSMVGLMLPEETSEPTHLVLRATVGGSPGLIGKLRLPIGSGSGAGYAFSRGEAIVIENLETESRFQVAPIAREMGTRSGMVAPMMVGEHVIGVLSVSTTSHEPFDADDLRLLSLIANTTAAALERARLFGAEREQRELAEALRDAGTALSATLNSDDVLARLLDQIARVVPYDAANVLLIENGRVRVVCQRGYGQFGEQCEHEVAAISFEIATTPNLRRMAETGQPLIIPDTTADPEWVKLGVSAQVRAWAGAPIIVHGEVLAFFSLDKIEANYYRREHAQRLAAFAGQAALALQNARLYESLDAEKRRLELLYNISQNLAASYDSREVAGKALDLIMNALGAFKGEVLMSEAGGDRLRLVAVSGYDTKSVEALDRQLDLRLGQGIAGRAALMRAPIIAPDVLRDQHWLPVPGLDDWVRSVASIPLLAGDELMGVLNVLSDCENHFHSQDLPLLTAVSTPMALALQNAQLFESLRQSEGRFRRLAENAPDAIFRYRLTPTRELEYISPAVASILGYTPGECYADPDLLLGSIHPDDQKLLGQLLSGEAQNQMAALRWQRRDGAIVWTELRVTLLYDEAAGSLCLEGIARDITERKQAEETLRRRAEELEAMAHVSTTLRQAQNLDEMRSIILETTRQVMGAQAGAFFLLDADAQELYVAAAYGYPVDMSHLRLKMGEGIAGQCARSGLPILTDDIAADPRTVMPEALRDFHKALCFPLKSTAGLTGVLLICFAAPGQPTATEVNLLAAVAEMAGNALHRTTLHEQTQLQAVELALAYDSTLEGWARALELRDKETEGHTQRVTEMTLRLAQAMGIGNGRLVDIRRGALLHDIGKMGIPDSILLKPGPLDEGEWVVMRRHPTYAYDMLSPIAYLRSALDIPFSHHEKWDGTGYPRGLKGKQIPLAARVFAVVDVWDALRSDRPYRKGWPAEKVREHIRSLAETHFDPDVAKVFLEITNGKH